MTSSRTAARRSAPAADRGGAPDLDQLFLCRRGAEWALVAAWGLELGFFDALAGGAASVDRVAERTGTSRRGARILLGALEELDAVAREPGGYRLTGGGRARFVDTDTPDFSAGSVRHWLRNVGQWSTALGEAVRRGEAVEVRTPAGARPGPEAHAPPGREGGAEDQSDAPSPAPSAGGRGPGAGSTEQDAGEGEEGRSEEELASFMAAMDAKEPSLVTAVVDGCLERVEEPVRVLDLGGGPGTFAREFARRGVPTLLFDRRDVVDHVADAYGLRDVANLELAGGDFMETLPEGPFDIILLANITHIFAAERNRELLGRVASRVRPGGAVGILDFVRGLSPFAALFAVTMLLNTEEGDTYGLPAYQAWLGEAGFADLRWRSADEDRHLLTACRAEA